VNCCCSCRVCAAATLQWIYFDSVVVSSSCLREAQATTKHYLLTDLVVFNGAELTLKCMGLWLCGVCFRTHLFDPSVVTKMMWGCYLHSGFTLALLDSLFFKGLHIVKSIHLKCRLRFSRVLKGALDKVICMPDDISCWVILLVLPLCLLKTFRSRSNLKCMYAIKRQCHEESIVNAIHCWGVLGGSLQLLRETLAESSSTLSVDDEDIDLGE
nr:putative reverse transcriptase domain-containing protein [Tanacetum cinerariifolium]